MSCVDLGSEVGSEVSALLTISKDVADMLLDGFFVNVERCPYLC